MTEPEKKSASASDEIYLLDYLIILAKHSRLIIFTSLAVMVLTYLILFLLPKQYKATVCMLPPQQNLSMVELNADIKKCRGFGENRQVF